MEEEGRGPRGQENIVMEEENEMGMHAIIASHGCLIHTYMYKSNTHQTSSLHVAESLLLGLIH